MSAAAAAPKSRIIGGAGTGEGPGPGPGPSGGVGPDDPQLELP